jgi:thiamine-phosphate pyrophosphorylase
VIRIATAARERLPRDGWLGIHDRAHLVPATRADAVHLGFRSLTPEVARAIVADEIAIGFSAHADDDAETWTAADYLVFGPVLDTSSKRGWKDPVGFDGLARAVARAACPVWALGGLKPEHAGSALTAGARGIAVQSGIFGADPSGGGDPAGAVRAYERALAALDAREQES